MKFRNLVFITALIAFIAPAGAQPHNPDTTTSIETIDESSKDYQQRILFNYILDYIQKNHYKKATTEELVQAAIQGMMRSLDAHSSYTAPKDAEKQRNDLRGEISGIGATLTIDKERGNSLTIVDVLPGGPADKAGIKAGDIIDEVDGHPTSLVDLQGAIEKITGPVGTEVKLKIIHKGKKEWFTLTRAVIKKPIVRFEILQDDIAFVRLEQFTPNASEQIRKAWKNMTAITPATNIKGIILDLRYNPGGLLDQAATIVDMFSSHGTAVIVKDGNGVETERFDVSKEVFFPENIPLVILINRYSASASEIVSGSLKQMGRAFLIGEKTYGKGSVQTVSPVYNGGLLRLTMQHYFTHNDTSPHDVGIEPNLAIINDVKKTIRRTGKIPFDDQLRAAINHINASK